MRLTYTGHSDTFVLVFCIHMGHSDPQRTWISRLLGCAGNRCPFPIGWLNNARFPPFNNQQVDNKSDLPARTLYFSQKVNLKVEDVLHSGDCQFDSG